MASRDISAALRITDFRWLWFGSVGSSFAMNMQSVARGWLVYTLTSSTVDLAWVTLSFMTPTVLFSLWGGVVADRYPKRMVIVLGQGVNCALTLAMAWIILSGRIDFWDFIWFGFLNGSVLAFSMPARQAFVPELIPDTLIFTGMALNTTSWNLSRTLGPALAGLLIAWTAAGDTTSTYGVGIVYLVIAALYFLSAFSMTLVSKPGEVKAPDGKSPLKDVADGLVYVWRHPPVFGLILMSIVPFLFGMPLNTLLPAFNHDVLNGGPDDLGYLISFMGIGAIVGSLVLASKGEMRHKAGWLLATCLAWGVMTLIFGLTIQVWLCWFFIAIIGGLSAWNMSLNRGLLQLQVEQSMRGRILSIDMMSHGLMPIGVIPISFIAEAQGVDVALAVSGIVFMLLITLLYFVTPSVRRVDEGTQLFAGSGS